MKVRGLGYEFIVPKEQEEYVLFMYSNGAFDIRVKDNEVEIYIPRRIRKLKEKFGESFEILKLDMRDELEILEYANVGNCSQ